MSKLFGAPKIVHSHSPAALAAERRKPGLRSWLLALLMTGLAVALFYAVLALAPQFVIDHADATAYSLVTVMVGSVVWKLVVNDAVGFVVPSFNRVAAHAPTVACLLMLSLFLIYWHQGERISKEENDLCAKRQSLVETADVFKNLNDLADLDKKRRSRLLTPWTAVDERCVPLLLQ